MFTKEKAIEHTSNKQKIKNMSDIKFIIFIYFWFIWLTRYKFKDNV